jgi:hypothetical protein
MSLSLTVISIAAVTALWSAHLMRRADRRGLEELLGQDAKCPEMGPAVVFGQDLAEAARAIGDGAVVDLAACDRKACNGNGQATGLSSAHHRP